jgi:formylglycine-generating enzyme required for sulfatase activity
MKPCALVYTSVLVLASSPLGHNEPPILAQEPRTKPGAQDSWENSLDMRFRRVGEVFLSIWETRVRDFQAFVSATGYDATIGMWSISEAGWKQQGRTWKEPGFPQTPDHPVCGVSWNDAEAYSKQMNSEAIRKENPELDYDGGGMSAHVLRGAAWNDGNATLLLGTCRHRRHPANRRDTDGFRCVLVIGGQSR